MDKLQKILMVDDDSEDRMIMQDLFKEIGAISLLHYEENGEEALTYLENCYQQQQTLPNLIVLDLNMPRLNGTQVLKKIKQDERFQDISVIIFSTSLNPLEKNESLKSGALSYIIKPMTYDECRDTAKYFINLSSNLS